MVRETCKGTELYISSLIGRTDEKIDEKIIKTNTHLENYSKQQNLDFTDNSNIKKFDLDSRGLHLVDDRGSGKSAKTFLDYLHLVCATGNSFPDRSEQCKVCIIKELRNNKFSHRKCVSLGYLNINSIYRPPDQNLDYFLSSFTSLLHHYLKSFLRFFQNG